jgi:hypothetical protein
MTGSIYGVITDASGGAPLKGVTVTAQVLGPIGPSGPTGPVTVTSATTDDQGQYTLGILPLDTPYYVVCQPVVAAATTTAVTAYKPRASPAITLTTAAPVLTWNAAFDAVAAASTGGISATISDPNAPAPTATYAVQAWQQLAPGAGYGSGSDPFFIVRVQPDTTDGTHWIIDTLPASPPTYSFLAERSVSDGSGGFVKTYSPAQIGSVTGGASVPVPLGFP